jgi:hypothetical protein
MTRRNLRNKIIVVILIYAVFIVIGSCLYYFEPIGDCKLYIVFKDLILLWVAIPAAYLGDCFQRRAAFTDALRKMWANLINSVNQARQFTFDNSPTHQSYGAVLRALSESIDEVRGVYSNIDESKSKIGIYPYESIKEIQAITSRLSFTTYDKQKADEARCAIDFHWGLVKSSFLFEFDRPVPTVVNTPYREFGEYNHWEKANCVQVRSKDGSIYFKHRRVSKAE